MPELYWCYVGAFVLGMLIGVGTRLWNMPAKKPPPPPEVQIGDVVYSRFRFDPGYPFRVTGECMHLQGRALFLERCDDRGTVVPGGQKQWRLAWCVVRRSALNLDLAA